MAVVALFAFFGCTDVIVAGLEHEAYLVKRGSRSSTVSIRIYRRIWYRYLPFLWKICLSLPCLSLCLFSLRMICNNSSAFIFFDFGTKIMILFVFSKLMTGKIQKTWTSFFCKDVVTRRVPGEARGCRDGNLECSRNGPTNGSNSHCSSSHHHGTHGPTHYQNQ